VAPPLKRLPVRYANMMTGRWTQEETWPPARARAVTLYAHAGGRLAPEPPADATAPTEFVFDPKDPTPHLGGPLLDLEGAGLLDNAELECRGDVVTFTSAPLDKPLVLAGAPTVHLAADSSAPTTDFFLRLNHVRADGTSTNVAGRFVRRHEGQLPVDDAFELFPIVYEFDTGDRLRLLIASGAHPRYARNHGTGEHQAIATKFVVQEQSVFHEKDRQTFITLPVL
jgi:putative CocE/NonD family hydrolase